MKIITCTGYYGTGSSAVTDYLSEFDNIYNLTNFEFRFVHDPDGISDLEYNLIENHNRQNSGHAIKRFKRLVDYYGNHLLVKRYEPFFNNQWKKISYEYIDKLTDFKYKGIWQYDFLDKGPLFEFITKLPDRILHRTIWKNQPDKFFNPLPNEVTYCGRPTKENFLKYTKEYIDDLMNQANVGKLPYLMVDQIVPPSNLPRYLKYFSDIKVFIVDRDPRDLFLLSKYIWKDGIVPKENTELFCKWFAYTHSHRQYDTLDSRVLLIQFEDLIYKYDETTKKILDWLEIDNSHHKSPFTIFQPNKSIKNTKLWEQNSGWKKEADEIAFLLPEYLYT